MEFGVGMRAARMRRVKKIDVVDANFNMQGSNIWNIIEKRLKTGDDFMEKCNGITGAHVDPWAHWN